MYRENISNHMVQVVATDRNTFEIRQLVLSIQAAPSPVSPTHEVQLKIDNLNIEDILKEERRERLLNVFRDR